MAGRIITARHGCPHMDRTVNITAEEYGVWWGNYDLAGLAPGEEPPQSLIDLGAECQVVLSSTLPRAIETAAMVVKGARTVPQDALYVEAPLPPPPVPRLKLNPTRWGQVSRAFWFFGYAPNGIESHKEARARVRLIVDRLETYTATGQDVLLCAHGYLNWMIDGHIRQRGWQRVDREGQNHYWSWRAYRQKDPSASHPNTAE